MQEKTLKFQVSRRDLYAIIRISAARRPFRRVALPALAVFVFLGHAMDGNYGKGFVWAVVVAALYWGVSHLMYGINVYGAGNDSLLVPQEIQLRGDQMVVTSEHSTEAFPRPDPSDVKIKGSHLVITTGTGELVFLERSFGTPGDYAALKSWLMSGKPGPEDAVSR